MKPGLAPLRAGSLIDLFVQRFERQILSGKLAIGQKLPTERELALELGVGRQVVHEGLMLLAAKGLVTMRPRSPAVVSDYRREGSLALLQSLAAFQGNKIDRKLLEDLVALRTLVEVETARLAALHRTEEHLQAFAQILEQEAALDRTDLEGIAATNFAFHHQVALSTNNAIYPLLINSTKHLILHPVGRFYHEPDRVVEVFALHAELVKAIEARDAAAAMALMKWTVKKGFPALQGD